MKILFVLVLVLVAHLSLCQDSVEKLTAEPNHSTVGFAIAVAGFTRVTGKFMDFDLKLNYLNQDLTRSNVSFTIKPGSVDTGIDDRDESLQDERFFHTAQYPEIVFSSSSIERKNEDYQVEGSLTIRGVSKQVSIPLRVITLNNSIQGIQIRWEINRTDFGVGNTFKHTMVENFLSDKVSIEIDLAIRKDKR